MLCQSGGEGRADVGTLVVDEAQFYGKQLGVVEQGYARVLNTE